MFEIRIRKDPKLFAGLGTNESGVANWFFVICHVINTSHHHTTNFVEYLREFEAIFEKALT
jgi:hypothetical protein